MAGASRWPRTTVHAARGLGSAGWLAARGEGKPASVQWRGRVAPRSCERIRQPGSTARAGARPYTARRPGGGTRRQAVRRHEHGAASRAIDAFAAYDPAMAATDTRATRAHGSAEYWTGAAPAARRFRAPLWHRAACNARPTNGPQSGSSAAFSRSRTLSPPPRAHL